MLKQIGLVLVLGLLVGCSSMHSGTMYGSNAMIVDDPVLGILPENSATKEVQMEQMLIWTGSLSMEVLSISNVAEQITVSTKAAGGYIESSESNTYRGKPSMKLKLRVPSEQLQPTLESLETLGEVTAKELSSRDVTEQYVDTQARLETKKKLRDRLQQLLDRADEVKDVLAIERELTRIQSDIDSMTARLKAMKGKVDYASLTVRLNAQMQEQVPGPIGYVWNGTVWCVKKLFIWQDETYVQQ